MLADELDFVVGVDPHRDSHALAVVEVRGGVVVFETSVAADSGGYAEALAVAEQHAPGRRYGQVGDDRMNDPVAAFLRLAEIPRENLSEVEAFLGTQKTDSAALAVLERPDEPVALLKVDRRGEATLFSVVPAEHGSRLLHETYIGKVPDATVTQIHAIESLGGASAPQPERVEITGSRLMGQIDLTNYDSEQRATLIDALRMITDARS